MAARPYGAAMSARYRGLAPGGDGETREAGLGCLGRGMRGSALTIADGSSVRLLDVDPDLGTGLDARAREQARGRLLARTLRLSIGAFDPGAAFPDPSDHLGVLVLEGLMTRDVLIAETTCAELVGPGDLLRPWEHLGLGAPVPSEVEWHVLEPTTLAILDARVIAAAGPFPEVVAALVTRAVARAQTLSLSLAISSINGLKIRLLVLLWHLADRFGKVTSEGVSVPLPVTHQVIARLVGASRPSVSTALKELENEGRTSKRPGGGFFLHGEPPELARGMADPGAVLRAATS
jgi:CRP/FNR family transcriptional regulator, cyclic AMP receptor protein